MDELAMFSAHLNRPGFIGEIKSMLSELYQYGVTPEELKAQTAGAHVGQILSAKLSDMEVIFEAFREFTKEKYITLEELLDVLCQVADRSDLLRDSTMVLDGYTGFTPIQYRLIGILLKLCRNVFVTVSATMEPGMDLMTESDETDLFDMSRKMAGKLKRLAEENGVAVGQDIRLAEASSCAFQEQSCPRSSGADLFPLSLYPVSRRGSGDPAGAGEGSGG